FDAAAAIARAHPGRSIESGPVHGGPLLVRRLLPLLVFLAPALSACQSRPAALTDADRNAIRAVVANFDKAVLAADWPAAVSVYTEDGILMPPNGPVVQGGVAMQKFFAGLPKITAFKERVVKIEGYGDLVYPSQTYELPLMRDGS